MSGKAVTAISASSSFAVGWSESRSASSRFRLGDRRSQSTSAGVHSEASPRLYWRCGFTGVRRLSHAIAGSIKSKATKIATKAKTTMEPNPMSPEAIALSEPRRFPREPCRNR